MKRKIVLSTLVTMIALAAPITMPAADKDENTTRQWTREMLEYKHDFIAEQTEMTADQRTKFMPLYEAMEKEIYAVNRDAREQARKITATGKKVTDQEYYNVARVMASTKTKEGEIESRYFERFSKILNKRQLFLLKQAELKFTRQMISKGRK